MYIHLCFSVVLLGYVKKGFSTDFDFSLWIILLFVIFNPTNSPLFISTNFDHVLCVPVICSFEFQIDKGLRITIICGRRLVSSTRIIPLRDKHTPLLVKKKTSGYSKTEYQ